MEELKKWFFSFGQGHVSPSGYPLHNVVAEIEAGSYMDAREKMFSFAGEKWAFQYGSKEEAGVDRFNLRVLTLEELEQVW